MPSRFLYSFARFYNNNFDRRPTITLIVTNGLLNSVADILAQTSSIMLHEPTPHNPTPIYDPTRTLRFALFGMGMGPVIGKWLRVLEKRIPFPQKLTSPLPSPISEKAMRTGRVSGMRIGGEGVTVLKRVLADQAIMAPLGLMLFVSSMGIMEGHSTTEIKEKFQDIYIPAILANWKIWPIIQLVNFKLMPLQYRVPFQSTCGIAWTLYLSLLNAKGNDIIEEAHTHQV